MQRTMDNSQCTHPIDAMHLIHKALRVEAVHVEEAVDGLEMGGSFKPFQRAFYRWAMALGYHVEVEDHYFTTWFPDTPLAQAQEGFDRVARATDSLKVILNPRL